MLAELYITDGTTIVNLLGANNGPGGVGLGGARFSRPVRETAGIFAKTYAPVEETYSIKIAARSQDAAIAYQQALDRMLEHAVNYFQTPENTPVWLVSRASRESNPRYAVVIAGALRDYGDIYDQPFSTITGDAAMIDMELAITRSAWQATPPLAPACFPVTSAINWANYANSWAGLLAITNGKGIYWVRQNNYLFVGYQTLVKTSLDNGVNWVTAKTFSAGNIARAFTVAFGKVFMAVANTGTANADSGVWSCTLTGGTFTQEISGVNYYSIATRPSDGAVLAGGTDVIKIKATSAGSWTTYSSAVKGSPTCLVYTDTGALIVADSYDVWRQPSGGTFARTDCEIPGPYVAITYFKGRLLIVTASYTALSTNDGVSFARSDLQGGDVIYYHAGHDMVYRSLSNAVYKSIDDGKSWISDTSAISGPGGGFTQTATGVLLMADASFVRQRSNATVLAGTRDETCTSRVYIGNRNSSPILATVQYFDDSASTYTTYSGANYLSSGSNILPTAMGVNDVAYFGGMDPAAYFNAIVFELTVSNKTATFAYEYFNGVAWTAIPNVVDLTYGLKVSGSISWPQPSDWALTSVTGGNQVFFRIRVTATGTITATPQAKNVYIPSRNWVEVSGIGGDLPALARLALTNVSDGGAGINETHTGAVMLGMRSVDRGEFFTSMFTLEDNQIQANFYGGEGTLNTSSPYMVMDDAGETSLITNPAMASTGRYILYNPVTLNTWGTVATVYIAPAISQSFHGTHRAFLRYFFYGTDMAVKVRLGYRDMPSPSYRYAPEQVLRDVTSTLGGMRLLDLGQINLGGDRALSATDKSSEIRFSLQMQSSIAGAPGQVGFSEIILIPVDEWTGYFQDTDRTGFAAVGAFNNIYLDIDSATAPKRALRSLARNIGSDLISGNWSASASGPMVLQPGKTQRIYLVSEMWNQEYLASPFNQVYQLKLYAHERYLGMRGND